MKKLQCVAIPNIPQPDWEKLRKIPITECKEALQPASLLQGTVLVYPAYFKMGIPSAPPECHLRLSVYNRIVHAASQLPSEFRLVILDGWRPFSVQQHLYDTLINLMEHTYPDASSEELASEARNLVSPPSNLTSAPSPHLTGGSIDLTLADQDGRILNMGTKFDEASPLSYTASLEGVSSLSPEQKIARDNRRVLYNVMIDAGFTNLPSEWWHFDFGNQLWAWHSGNQQAIYGATHPGSLESLWQEQLRQSKPTI